MRSKGNEPNAIEKRWREVVGEAPSMISGRTPVEIHHPAGVTARFDKVHIGHWWLIPLHPDEHRVISVHGRKEFERRYNDGIVNDNRWTFRVTLFYRTLAWVLSHGYGRIAYPSDAVRAAILNYRR